ncbi:MAG: molybdopterin-dependent oxidoreductase, partial [Candidatus Limnocylindria bacterium]
MSERGPALTAGIVAMAGALLVAFLLSVIGFPFAPATLGQAVIEALPGWISVPLIELLQFWAQRLLILGVIAGFLACGAAAGLLAGDERARTRWVVAAGALPWAAAPVLGQLFAGETTDLGGSLFAAAVGAATFFGMLSFLLSAERVASPVSQSRRRALGGALAVAGVLAAGSLLLGGALRAARATVEPVALRIRNLRVREEPAPGDAAFEAIAGLEPRLTEAGDHYTVDTALIDPRVDATAWKLHVGGHVERPFEIGYEELLDLPAVERPHTLECISNEIGGDLTSTAIWAGVPMADLLARAAPLPGAFDVVMTSVDGYTDSVRIAKAQDPDTLVAYLMNGQTLPEQHGYPLRALIPGIYGMKNVKWLTRIDVVTGDFLGYWMERGWSDIATYNTHVRIDSPAGPVRAGAAVQVAGIAFAGSRGIERVEVSTDGGETWADAELER